MNPDDLPRGDPRISPTAYATASAWARYGFPESERFDTKRGRAMLTALDIGTRLLAPIMPVLAPGADILLTRHAAFTSWVEAATPGIALEIGAGLAGRGLNHARRHPACQWLDVDLPGMVTARRRRMGNLQLPANYRLEAADLLADELADQWAARLPATASDPTIGPAIAMTEGVIEYLSPRDKQRAWANIAGALARCGGGRYLCEVYPLPRFVGASARRQALAARVVPTLTRHEDDALDGLIGAGFREARPLAAPGPGAAFCLIEAAI